MTFDAPTMARLCCPRHRRRPACCSPPVSRGRAPVTSSTARFLLHPMVLEDLYTYILFIYNYIYIYPPKNSQMFDVGIHIFQHHIIHDELIWEKVVVSIAKSDWCEQKHRWFIHKARWKKIVFQSQTPISCPAKILIWYLKNQDSMERSTIIWASMQENWWKRPKNGLDESEDPERDRVTTFEGPFFTDRRIVCAILGIKMYIQTQAPPMIGHLSAL